MNILPHIVKSERCNFLGPTGSGKTELARSFLRAQRNVIVVDTKRAAQEFDDWESLGESVSEKDVFRCRGGRYIYRVSEDFLVDPERPEKFFRWALRAGNRVIYVDEMLDVIPVAGLKILATQGRSNNVGLWVATQRPYGIPIYTISEAQHSFVFRLRVDRDRERIESVTGTKINWDSLKPRYSFVYINETGDVSRVVRLNLGEPVARVS